jgi:hypothetical protein
MIIEEKITEFLNGYKKVNENIIYLADIEVEITKLKVLKTKKVRGLRKAKIEDYLFEKNPGESNRTHMMKQLGIKCNISDSETLVIKKVILKKEISCSLYKR